MAARNIKGARSNAGTRNKVKTGCITCRPRIRKIKCDEGKPSCHKCVSTGRSCDGYQSPFRLVDSELIKNAQPYGDKSLGALQSIRSRPNEVTTEDIEFLTRCLSTKTIFVGVKVDCEDEVKQILQASSTDPSIRYAISSLKALRNGLEVLENGFPFVLQQNPSYAYGAQQYSVALKGLASNLSSLGIKEVRSALLCCQIFISIEQVQANYSAMAQHIIGGLRIMQEYRTRHFIAGFKLGSTEKHQLPPLDTFVIKLFATPCKFKDVPVENQEREIAISSYPITVYQQPADPRELYILRHSMRIQLTKVAALIVEFLAKVSKAESVSHVSLLLPEKAGLLESLGLWLDALEVAQGRLALTEVEPISVSFMRLFHSVLKVVLLGTLASSIEHYEELQTEIQRLQSIADLIDEGVKRLRT